MDAVNNNAIIVNHIEKFSKIYKRHVKQVKKSQALYFIVAVLIGMAV